jgi:hypothetical protein
VPIQLRKVVDQIRSLDKSIAEQEKTSAEEDSKLEGHKDLPRIKGIGKILDTIILSLIRNTSLMRANRRATSVSARACRTRMGHHAQGTLTSGAVRLGKKLRQNRH